MTENVYMQFTMKQLQVKKVMANFICQKLQSDEWQKDPRAAKALEHYQGELFLITEALASKAPAQVIGLKPIVLGAKVGKQL